MSGCTLYWGAKAAEVEGKLGMTSEDEGERERLFALTGRIIAVGMKVHRALGPGLLESAYEACLAYELAERGMHVERQKPLPLTYCGVELECGYRLDLLVERAVIVELKAVDQLEPIHHAQLITYLRLSGYKVGLLMNFNVAVLHKGIRRLLLNI